ncbi:MAG: filamentous hemagglutinin N-terminal domain-containing protein, partial [Cyanobacteria bacterium P01_F01_bin.153]
AQEPIAPALDGLNTGVIRQGDRFIIQGGQLSGDGSNLFHGFERFNVPTGQTADFQATPQLQNILGRISGGEPSVIDGTLQITGGDPNLFLLNPAGAIFGPNAQLNVPASFHFSTADQVQFGNDFWNVFDGFLTSAQSFSELNGLPTGFRFGSLASVANFGALAVAPGASLTLMGGTVVNAGSLMAPGGTVTLAAVEPGWVRLGTMDGILQLDFEAAAITPEAGLNPLRLPELLAGAGSDIVPATEIVVDPTTGFVTLGNTTVESDPGVAIASGEISASSTDGVGGTVNVLGDRVAVAGGTIRATGATGGGVLQLGGGFQGNGPVWNATLTSVDTASSLDVSATEVGDGGMAIVWADDSTWFWGDAIARGGPAGGDGGLIETSGLRFLDVTQGFADTTAISGAAGNWLLDPIVLRVVSDAAANPAD